MAANSHQLRNVRLPHAHRNSLRYAVFTVLCTNVPIFGIFILIHVHMYTVTLQFVDLSWPFYLGSGTMWLQLQWQIWTADIHDPKNLWQRFNSNKYTGGLLALAIAAGHI